MENSSLNPKFGFNPFPFIIGLLILVGVSYFLRPDEAGVLTVKSVIVPFILSCYIAAALCAIIIGIYCKFCGVELVGISVGIPVVDLIGQIGRVELYIGLLPLPDMAVDNFSNLKGLTRWVVTSMPSVIIIVVGFALGALRNYFYTTSPEVDIFGIPVYSLVALLALACIFMGVLNEINMQNKMIEMCPEGEAIYRMVIYSILICTAIVVYNNWEFIKHFIYQP